MAARMATTSTVVGLVNSSLSSPKRTSLNSGFLKSQVTARNPLKIAQASGGKFTCFERDWLRRDLNVIGFGLIGWLAPSSIPAINGKSLSGLFFESIGTELSHFPTGPGVTSQFWGRFTRCAQSTHPKGKGYDRDCSGCGFFLLPKKKENLCPPIILCDAF
ncbi:photosystem I subunit O isoform X1 [Nicotiana tabacum]|uniref:Photosystem I subunit O isoform X1 n=1 Tax=Nicotiana tabacum TaxID=4097 RepID=A0AC58TEF0_TOBAC